MAKRDLLIFTGNCQAQHLAAVFEASGAYKSIFVGRDFGFTPAYAGIVPQMYLPREFAMIVAAARQEQRKIVLAWQASPLAELDMAMARRVDQVVQFPEARFYTMRPKVFEKRFKTTPKRPERIFQFDIKNIELSQKKAAFPVDMAEFTARRIKQVSLFHTISHPTGEFLAQLARGIQLQLGETGQSDALVLTIDGLSRVEGLNVATDHPVPKSVRDAIGMDWGEVYETYAQMLNQFRVKSWRAYEASLPTYERLFQHDSQYWKSLAAYAGRKSKLDLELSRRAYEELRDRSPGLQTPWASLAKATMKSRGWIAHEWKGWLKEKVLGNFFTAYGKFRTLPVGFRIPWLDSSHLAYEERQQSNRQTMQVWIDGFLADCKDRTRNSNLSNAVAIRVWMYAKFPDKAEECARTYFDRCLKSAKNPVHVVNRLRILLKVLHARSANDDIRELVFKHAAWPPAAQLKALQILQDIGCSAIAKSELEAEGEKRKAEGINPQHLAKPAAGE